MADVYSKQPDGSLIRESTASKRVAKFELKILASKTEEPFSIDAGKFSVKLTLEGEELVKT